MYPYDNNSQSQFFQNQLLQSIAPSMQPQARHVTKVNGRAGAESFTLPPNSDDILLDMNEPVIYFIQSDGAGYKTITSYDISIHKEVNQTDLYNTLDQRITKLEEVINGKSNYRPNEQKPKSGPERNDASNRGNDKG